MTLTIDRRFRGPSGSGNGGYAAGALAAWLAADVVTVTLRRPPPLDVPLGIDRDATGVRLVDGEEAVAEAAIAAGDDLIAVPAVGAAEAAAASAGFPGFDRHPFPECFVCGPSRPARDGMRLFPGRIEGDRTTCVWTVDDDLAGDERFVWAALDCPGGWTAPIEGRPMVLGRMTATIRAVPRPTERCVVMGRLLGTEGRKTWTATTAYGADGRELGRAAATWITVRIHDD